MGELGYLFHMLRLCPKGHTCQAQNLLRALRQVREAGLLGLLEGAGDETNKDRSLPRRARPPPREGAAPAGPARAPRGRGRSRRALEGPPTDIPVGGPGGRSPPTLTCPSLPAVWRHI